MDEISVSDVRSSEYDVVVAGAGAGGLLTALALTGAGHRVLVVEAQDHPGGVWWGHSVDGFRVDQGLHVITRVRSGPFARFIRRYLRPPPSIVLHDGWYFRVHDRVGTIPNSIGAALRWPLTGLGGRFSLIRIGAKIKTMDVAEMREYKDITFLEFMHANGVTDQNILDVMQSAIYMAAGVPIDRASAYEALRTLKDTDKELPRGESLRRILFGSEEYDEGVVVGGMRALVEQVVDAINGDYVLGAPVERVIVRDGRVKGLVVAGREIGHHCVVSNIPLRNMPRIVDSTSPEVTSFFERWSNMLPTRGLTLWLGLDRVVIGDRKSRVVVHPTPCTWIVSLSSFDPTCAPEGKELVGVATVLLEGDRPDSVLKQVKENVLARYFPGLLRHTVMEHVQVSYATRAALVPGQTALDRPGPRTPARGLYIVGTDTAGEGVGLQQAANSATGVVRALLDDIEYL